MKNEKKFLIYSFIIIFSLLFILIALINYNNYKKETHHLIDNINQQLEICSYKLNCKNIKIDFQKKSKNIKPFILQQNDKYYYKLFQIKNIKKYYLKLSYPKNIINQQINKIKNRIIRIFFVELIIILIITGIFIYILLIPLKEAYKINETFIKDILHDLNTPLTTLKLNLYLLKKKPDNKRIEEIEKNIQTILKYQQHLKDFLSSNPQQKELVDLKELIDEKLKFYSSLYPNISYENKTKCKIIINKAAFNSILENLLSNAFKYNKTNGKIEIFLKNKKLYIKDTGIGIKNPKQVFNRFYKEQERGTGIGMNIVKKLCDELKIPIKIYSEIDKGTTIILDLKNYC